MAIYAASNLQLKDVSPDADDVSAVELEINDGEKLIVVSYYTPPGTAVNLALLDPLLATYPAALILGDLNAKHQFFGCTRTDRAGELLFNVVEETDLIQLNKPDQLTYFGALSTTPDILDYTPSPPREQAVSL